jgi:hypothetical protein
MIKGGNFATTVTTTISTNQQLTPLYHFGMKGLTDPCTLYKCVMFGTGMVQYFTLRYKTHVQYHLH